MKVPVFFWFLLRHHIYQIAKLLTGYILLLEAIDVMRPLAYEVVPGRRLALVDHGWQLVTFDNPIFSA